MATLAKVLAPVVHNLGPTVTTTGAVATTLARVILPDTPGAYFVEARILGMKSDASAAASYWRQGIWVLTNTGSLAKVGSTRTVGTDNESDANWTVTLTQDSVDAYGDGVLHPAILVQVTGVALTTITWRGVVEVIEVA